jgi:transcriptional regulator GlxA family with amidase domain
MKHLTILVPQGQHNLSSIVGSYKIFTKANEYWESRGNTPIFKIQLAGISKSVTFHDGIFIVKPHILLTQIKKTDLVIIPALKRDFPKLKTHNKTILNWLRDQHKNGAEIASICTGAFMLASTGLLDGKNCSTHWVAVDAFSKMFPKVNLVKDKIITDESGIYTNGGAFSFLNLILYLIEKYYDRQTAVFCAKVFQIEIDRYSQSPFIVFTGQKNHGDELIKKAQIYIENNSSEKINVEELATMFATGRRNFDRRFKTATSNTPLEYLQRVRIETAKKSLESTNKNINEVMYDVGYSDIKAFREVFRKITGLSPLDYKNKFNKEQLIK